MEKLRKAHEHLSQEQLLDLVCHLTKTYVIEQTIPFDVPLPERAEPRDRPDVADPAGAVVDDPEASPVRRFARLIEGLKRRAELPQLDGFSVQDGKVVLVVDNQKVTFGERVTIEFVPVRQSPTPAAAPARDDEPAPRAPGAPPRARPEPAPRAEAAPFAAPPARTRPATPATPATRPGAPSRAGRPEPKPAAPDPRPAPQPTSEGGDDVDQNAIERFKRLELD
jgi:hypothetical protein